MGSHLSQQPPSNPQALSTQSNSAVSGSSSGSEAHLSSLRACFTQAANSITSLYKQSTFSYNVAYQQGKQDAFEEVFQWFMR